MKIKKKGVYEKFIKRALDIIISLTALVILGPIMLIVAILVKIKLGSPVIFKQERPGKNEKIFCLYKFRSMTNEKDKNEKILPEAERFTLFGQKLRKTSLDELPELLNIIKGDMSIVGPRPLLVAYLPYYTEQERKRHFVRPGLTGLAQVNGRNFVEWDKRLEWDVKYIENISFTKDLKIILRTMIMVFQHKNVAADSGTVEGNLAEIRQAKAESVNI